MRKKIFKDDDVARKDVDEAISLRLLSRKGPGDDVDAYEMDLTKATGQEAEAPLTNQLSRVIQLSGFSDPIYAEGYVNINQFDIALGNI